MDELPDTNHQLSATINSSTEVETFQSDGDFTNSSSFYVDVSKDIIDNIERCQIIFTDVTDVKDSIKDSSSLLLLSTENTFLSTVRVYQALNLLNFDKQRLLTTDYASYCRHTADINQLFDNDNYKLLVMPVESSSDTSSFSDLVESLTQLIEDKPKVKAVLVIKHVDTNKLLVQLTNYCYEFKVLRDDDLDFHSLTFETQNYLLAKQISFQGKLIPISKIVNESNSELINSEIIVKLISDEVLSIGTAITQTEGYDQQMYIDRKFKNRRILKLGVLKTNSDNDKFAISNISLGELESMINPSDKICTFDNYNGSDKVKFIILSTNKESEQFKRLNLITDSNCHWLSKIPDGLLWYNSTGNHFLLHQYLQNQLMKTCHENELISLSSGQTLFIISGDAGSGKSTTLTHLALLIKEQFSNLWIIRINLRDYISTFQTKLKSNCYFTVSEAINFLFCSQIFNSNSDNLQFSEKLFKSMLEKVIVMFDGFDEVPTRFMDIAKSLISATVKADVYQIWLVNRSHFTEVLEDGFQCFSYEICPLNMSEQIATLAKYWKLNLTWSMMIIPLRYTRKICCNTLPRVANGLMRIY
ncbi:hypothetical protein CHUAL_006849 [Chamberlinius hualienensis]